MFAGTHFAWLAITIAMVAILTFCSVKFKFKFKSVMLAAIIVCIVCIIERIVTGIIPADINGDVSWGYIVNQTEIPLHLCSIMVFAYIALYFLKDGKVKDTIKSFVAVIGIMGAVVACLIPTQGTGFANPNTYEYFIYHAALIWIGLYLLITKQASMKLSAYLRNLLVVGSLVLIMLFVDSALSVYHVNYFFLVRPPMENLPILNLDHGWIVYFITIIGFGLLAITLFHLPAIIKEFIDKDKAKKQAQLEQVEDIDNQKKH